MPFLLDGNPTTSEISEAVNYLLGNFPVGNTVDPDTGQVVSPGGEVYGYIYKYMAIKYADSYDGAVGFSNTPTNKSYYGLRNSNTSSESNNPADYVWYQATGGFGTLKFLWYIATGGRQIRFAVATTAPDAGWVQDPGSSIDLDVVTSGNIPVISETFVGFFAPSVLQVPRSGNPLAPVFTNVIAKLYATDGGVIIPFVDAQTDTAVSFVNNTWRIGNSSTTGNGDISYTNITVGNPTDGGDFAEWPVPTAMSSSPAYISVPIRYKNSLGVITQASVASIQLLFADPGAAGQDSPYIDISGYTGFSVNAGGAFSPTTATLTAVTTAVTSPTYSWAITNATPTSSTNSAVVITPNASVGSVTATLTVNGSNLLSPLTKTITMPVVYQGQTGQAGQNGVQSAFPQIYIWTGASTPPARPTTTSTYTWADGSYAAPADWYTTAPSNTTAGNFLWSITIPLNVSATTTTSTLDWTNVAYPIRCIAYNGSNGNNGNSASAMFLNSSAQTFTYDSGGNANPASQTITFTANPQNIVGTTLFTATNYDVNNNPIGSPSLGGSGNTRTLAIADFGIADHCEVVASLSGYSDTVTVVKLQDGLNTTTGYLTNESVTVQTDSSGGGGVYTSAGGTFKVFNGTTDVTTSSAFTATPSTGLSLTINATTGVYTVTDLTVAQGTATLTAVYGGVTVTKVYTISKSYAGSVGSAGAATFVITRAANDSSTPTNAEVNTAIGRNPVPGDIVTISYNTGNNAVVYRCTNFNTGTGVATWVSQATYITGSLIVENTITAANIKAGTITADQIASNTITGGKIASTTITGDNIATGTVTAANMVTGTITAASAIIADAAITNAKIANLAVDAAKIADASIGTAKIGDAQVSTLKIGANAVTVASSATGTLVSFVNNVYTQSIASVTVTIDNSTLGQPIILWGFWNGTFQNGTAYCFLKRDGGTLKSSAGIGNGGGFIAINTPTATGTFVFDFIASNGVGFGTNYAGNAQATIVALLGKR